MQRNSRPKNVVQPLNDSCLLGTNSILEKGLIEVGQSKNSQIHVKIQYKHHIQSTMNHCGQGLFLLFLFCLFLQLQCRFHPNFQEVGNISLVNNLSILQEWYE